MELIYRRATAEDLDLLVRTRIEVLRAANGLDGAVDMSEVEAQSRDYYRRALAKGAHIAYLVFDGEELAGAGGISFYRLLPTYHNPTGENAYIMNMYTRPAYRRRGIAYRTLDLLVAAARERGVSRVTLEATRMGRSLYEKYGFVGLGDEMELPV
nr:GNAT family N-acetyltransferase [uncultured Oscillibacter sp.]